MMSLFAQTGPWTGIDVGEQLFYFSPLLILLVTMLAIVACPIVLGRGPKIAATLAGLGTLAALLTAWRVSGSLPPGGMSGLSPEAGSGILIADHLSLWFQVVLLVFLAGVMWLWWTGGAERERNAPEFFILLLGSALGMALMAATQNLLMIVVAIETASLPSYAIVGFDKQDRKGAEASLKYMVFGAVCAAIMLYGASLLYGLVGSLNAADVAAYTVRELPVGSGRIVLTLGLLCFLVGIAFKISAVPFHFWCPDAFEGARVEVTTWLSVASKAAGLVLLGRLAMLLTAAVPVPVEVQYLAPVAWVLGVLAVVTCTVGNLAAYMQNSVKRLLAYSSIAHAGYMLMALAVFVHPSLPGHEAGMTALLFYVVVYLFMNLGAFGVTALVSWETGSDDIGSFTGLMRRAPWLAVPMVICLVSLIGIPPLAGFLGKWWVLVALGGMYQSPGGGGVWTLSTLGWVLVLAMLLNTVLSVYYYMRIVVRMTIRDEGARAFAPPIGGTVLVNLCAVALVALFFFGMPVKNLANRFSRDIYGVTASSVEGSDSLAGVRP